MTMPNIEAPNRKAKLERAPWLDRGYGLFKDPSRPVPVIAFPDGSSHELGERRSRGSRSVSAANCKVALVPVVQCVSPQNVEDVMEQARHAPELEAVVKAERGCRLDFVVPSVRDSLNVRQRENRGYDPTDLLRKQAA